MADANELMLSLLNEESLRNLSESSSSNLNLSNNLKRNRDYEVNNNINLPIPLNKSNNSSPTSLNNNNLNLNLNNINNNNNVGFQQQQIITTTTSTSSDQPEWSEDLFELEEEGNLILELDTNVEPVGSTSNLLTNNNNTTTISTIKPRAKRRAVRLADPDAIKTDKSCLRCRVRKVRCDRTFPVCSHCFGRGEDCNLHLFPPKQKSRDLSGAERERLELLEERLAQLEGKNNRIEEESLQSITSILTPEQQQSQQQQQPIIITPQATTTTTISTTSPMISSETYDFLSSLQQFTVPDGGGNNSLAHANIGAHSLDWRLATPQMATSLSQHLCNAFFDSCCSLLPTFNYFSSRSENYRGDLSNLSGPAKVAVAAFCAIGARPSVHSALLGIDSFSSTAKGKQPEALYMSAGTRRQNACDTLTREAHTLGFEQGLLDDATQENLGAVLALIQLMMFMELEPRRSRSLIRAAVGHFKDLNDAAADENEKMELKRTFAFAIYYADSLTSAWAKKSCLIAESDLDVYFNNIGIIVPNLPSDEILPVLESLLEPSTVNSSGSAGGTANEILLSLRTAVHLLMCWTAKIQRLFTIFASTPTISAAKLCANVNDLWTAIDQTRIGLQYLQAKVYSSADLLSTSPHAHTHSHSHSASSHSHETDFVARSIRSDRDLLDIITLIHVLLTSRKDEPEIQGAVYEQSMSRVRKGLRVLAFYSKLYASGADMHMTFHFTFQLEHNLQWTKMAMQRFGEPGGPKTKEEEVTDTELNWFREGLHSACFFTPHPEQRLLELRSHFEFMDVAIPSTPPITVSAETDIFQFNSVSGSGGGLGAGAGMGNGGSGVSSPANYANFFADGLSRNWDSDAGLEFF